MNRGSRVNPWTPRGRQITHGLVSAFVCVLAVFSIAAPASAQEPQTTLPDVEDEVMCPVCGTTLELASDSPQAIDERETIRELIAEGLTKEEIKDELVAEFGPEVLAEPSKEGFDLAAWLVPGLAVLIGAVLAFIAVRRWRSNSLPLSEREVPHEDAAATADKKRLDEDLKRYEL
jgi:cytochrome c-type biogenesis protein CcmH/NrfF